MEAGPVSFLKRRLLFFSIFCSVPVRGIIQGGSAEGKKEMRSAYEYPSEALEGEGMDLR